MEETGPGQASQRSGTRRSEKEKLHAILIQEWVSQLEADLINAHYARSRWNDTVLFEFLRDFSRRRLWKKSYPYSRLPITTCKLIPRTSGLRSSFFLFFTLSFYRVLINDTRCSPRKARRLGNRRFSLSSQAYVDFSACPPSLCIFIEYQPRISYSFLFVPMFPCRVFLPGIRNRVKLAKKTFRYSDQTRDRKLKYTWDSRSEIENRQTDWVSFFFRICMLFQWLFKGLTGW